LTSNSHSVSYAIDSYFAAWLYTYYPKHWLATILESETGKPDGLTKAISEIKQLGYKFSNVDINYSGDHWYFNEEAQAFVPPLSSIKKVGDSAMAEILKRRPFKSLRNLLWDDLGNWRFSKANKGVFENLCKIEAMGSLSEMRTGKIAHHRQLHAIMIDHYDILKKGPRGMSAAQVKRREKAGEVVPDILDVLLNRTYGLSDWTREEKILASADLASSVSNDLLFPDGLLERFEKKDILPITELPGGMSGIVWMMVREVEQKTTKNGKVYLRIRAQDHQNKSVNVKVWGQPKFQIPKFSIWLCEAKGDDQWGPSTSAFKMRALDVE
jgi:DNA polymerase III alpha subunit